MDTKFHPRMHGRPPFTVEVSNSPKIKGETIPRRNVKYRDHLLTRPAEDIDTVWDLVTRSVKTFASQPCMGWRDLIKIHTETTHVKKMIDGVETEVPKEWTYFELSGYRYITFREYGEMVLEVGSGLRQLGLGKTDRVHIYAATSSRWLATMHGATSQSMPIVTAYETLGEEGLRESILATKARAVFTDARLLKTLGKCLDKSNVEIVIHNDDRVLDTKEVDAFAKHNPGVRVVSFDELRTLGKESPTTPVPPNREDLCCIMYTSGTTGKPKGVSLKHKSVVAAVAGADSIVGPYLGSRDTVIAYLPMAHIFEMVFEQTCIFWGMVLGFGHPRSLSDAAVRNCAGDLRELRPTLMVGVPSIWETIMKGVTKKVQEGSAITRVLFWGALSLKCFLNKHGLPGSGILDSLVFKKVAEATGGRMRLCMSGAGPIAKTTMRFISMAICPMISGYGITETAAMAGVTDPLNWTLDAIGDIPGSIEMKLVDFKEAGYLSTNNPPQGEICIRGESVMEGYFGDPEETALVLTAEGWYKTGDIGEFDINGHIRVIDRKKSLVKSLNGEYLALEKLESVYRTAKTTANVCIYAAPNRARPLAIVVPTESILAEAQGNNETLQARVLEELQAAGRRHGLAGFEIVDAVIISEEPWTPENGLTTPSLKINRRGIVHKFMKDIEKASGNNNS